MLGTHTTEEGFVLTAFSSLYLDWGLHIYRDGEQLFYNPSCLSNESYGHKPSPKFASWEEAEEASLNGDANAFVAWTQKEWEESLAEEADELIEAYVERKQ